MRLLRHGGLRPDLNMALDEALGTEPPVLRLYAWEPPAISIGYFQAAAAFPEARLERDGMRLVRRVTGGAAIDHTDDLTYSVIARPDAALFAGDVPASYFRIHEAIAAGLRRLGVETAPRTDRPVVSDSGRAGEVVCFHKATAFDLLWHGRKIVGSAQRRTRERVIHHGSIPRRRNGLAGEAASLEDALGRVPEFDEVADAIESGFAETLGVRLERDEVTAEERAAAERIAREKFGNAEWTRRR